MLRPIPPQVAWQAITALAGVFTLVCALAAPVDLWRLTVKSHQGEPFLATATLASLPEERISTECLSMGPESDAPGSEMPFLSKANLTLDAARKTVEISTEEVIAAPALALVLRVQCEGAPLYARHFSALIPSVAAKAPEKRADATPPKRRGFRLSLLRGDTVEGVAAVIFPGQRNLQQDLVQQVIAGNPSAFPNGRAREVAAGTVLWFPDLRELRKSAHAKSPASAKAGASATRRSRHSLATPLAPAQAAEEIPAEPRNPVTLRRALELGDTPGPQECKQLMRLCGAETPVAAPLSPALADKAQTLESGVKELRLKQDGIDEQLRRLELSLLAMQKTIDSAPAPVQAQPAPPPPPPRVEIRTVVTSEPLSRTILLGIAGAIFVAAVVGFALGRRRSFSRELAGTDEQLDRMLATAATEMRELESTPAPAPAPRPIAPKSRPAPARPAPEEAAGPLPASAVPALAPEPALDNQVTQAAAGVDLRLESGRPVQSQIAGLSNEVLFEMDQALDNTRSMFTDVDRFIALGRTQNALSLLQFQVHKDPKDRDSWIKLLAIYRQERMDAELAKAAREFKSHFPRENPPAV